MLESNLRQHKSVGICLKRRSIPPLHRHPRNPYSALAHLYQRDYPTERGSVGGVPSKVDGKAATLGNHKPAELLRRVHRATTERPTFQVYGKRDGIDLWPHSYASGLQRSAYIVL